VNASLPKRIASQILDEFIRSGRVAPGERLPGVRDLVEHYGASRATISHALGLLEEQGWVQRRLGSGCYVMDRPAGGPLAPPGLIGYIAPNRRSDLLLRIYEGLERVCRSHGLHILIATTDNDYEMERIQVARMVEAGCRGILLYPATRSRVQEETDYLNSEHLDLPIVLVDMASTAQKRPQVVFDNHRLGFEMTQLLLREGHRRIAFVDLGLPELEMRHYSTLERYRGYRDALAAAGIEPRPGDRWYYWTAWDEEPGLHAASDIPSLLAAWRDDPDRATAVIALEDACAIQIIQTVQTMGLRVPDDLRVVGFDNLAVSRSFTPAFPTSNPDFVSAGRIAADALVRMIGGEPHEHWRYVLPVPLLRRGVSVPPGRLQMSSGREVPAG